MTSQKPTDRWYYAQDKTRMGPVSVPDLRRLLAGGVLKPTDMVLQQGTNQWRPLAEVAAPAPGRRKKVVLAAGAGFFLLALCAWVLLARLGRPNPAGDDGQPFAEAPRSAEPAKANAPAESKEILPARPKEPKKPPPAAPREPSETTTLPARPKEPPPAASREPPEMALPREDVAPVNFASEIPPRLVAQLGHSVQITSVALSGDGKWLVTGSLDQTARLWDVATGKEIRAFHGRSSHISSVALSGEGRWLVTGSNDKTARLWELATGKEVRAFQGHSASVNSVALSADGKWLVTGSLDKTARLWDVATGKEIRAFHGHSDSLNSVALSGDGKWLVTGSSDKTARLWDVATGKEIRAFHGHSDSLNSVALSGDGKWLVTGSNDKTARLWDLATGKEIRAFHGHSARRMALSADGKWLVTAGDKTARLWDLATGKEIRAFQGHSTGVNAVALSGDGKWLVTGGWDTARLWELATGKEVRAFHGHSALVWSVALSDGKWLVTGSNDKTARLWELATGKEVRAFHGHSSLVTSVALSGDGKWLVTGSSDGTGRLWELATGKEVRTFHGHSASVNSVALSGDGKWLVTGSNDKTARLWELATGKEVRAFHGHSSLVTSVALSGDGKWLVTGSSDGTGRLWELATGKEVRTFHGHSHWVSSVALSGDGKWLVTGSYDHTARLWELATGKEVRAFQGHSSLVTSVALSGDGKWLVTGSYDHTARLWELATSKVVRAFQGHSGPVTSVALSGDGKWLATGSWDSAARLWELATGKELCQLVSFQDGTWAVVDAEGRYDAANGGDVEGLHWVAGNETIALKQLKERYYDPGLLAKYLGFNKELLRRVQAFRQVRLFPAVAVRQADAASGRLTLDLVNRGGGLGKVQVFVNGKELLADARGAQMKLNPGQAKASLTVDIAAAPALRPGQKNKVTIYTWNQEGYLSSRGLDLDWDAPGRKDERVIELYAILGGISEYAGPALRLRYAAKDAEDMAQALTLGAKRLFGADKVHVTRLTTSGKPGTLAPTKANFQQAFAAVRKKARPDDVLFVYLAGHGVSLAMGTDQYCYLTQEARTTDMERLKDPAVLAQTAITSTELTEWVKLVPAMKVVLVLDTCAAGAAAKKLTELRQVTGDQIRAIERLKDRTGFHVLMGCAADKVSYEATPFEQGLLTHALLKGMRGAKLHDGGYLDVSELFQYAANEVPELSRGIGGVQKPLIAAPRGTSFDVARFTKEDQAAVPLKTVKPLVLLPQLQNAEKLFDDLRLMPALRERLANPVAAAARGTGPGSGTVFVDAEEMPGAVRPSGTYTVAGGKIAVRFVLIRDGMPLQKEPLRVEGTVADREALLDRLVEVITREAWSSLKR